jgi:hypothetical protein
MQALIDHIAAVVIGAALLFMALAMIYKSQDSSIQAVQVDLAKMDLRTLVDIIEQDFNNMGSGMAGPNASSDPTDRVVATYEVTGDYSHLEFWSLQAYTGPADPVLVRYRWKQEGTATFPDGTSVDTYLVERQAAGATAVFDRVTDFSITLRNDDLASVPLGGTPDELRLVRYVDVDVGMVSPVGTEDLLQQTRWAKRFRPLNLAGSHRILTARPY